MIKAIKPKGDYREIIEVQAPCRFFWDSGGSFDGIEFGPFDGNMQEWEEEMLFQCLDAIAPAIGECGEEIEALNDTQ